MHKMGKSEAIFYLTADDSNALLKVQMNCTIFECIHAKPDSQWNPSSAMKCWWMWIDECDARTHSRHGMPSFVALLRCLVCNFIEMKNIEGWNVMCRCRCMCLCLCVIYDSHMFRTAWNTKLPKKADWRTNERNKRKKTHSKNITHCSLSSFVSPRLVPPRFEQRMHVCEYRKIDDRRIQWLQFLEFNANWTIQIAIDSRNAIIKFHCRINDITVWVVFKKKETPCE